jgi:hypothetical protein
VVENLDPGALYSRERRDGPNLAQALLGACRQVEAGRVGPVHHVNVVVAWEPNQKSGELRASRFPRCASPVRSARCQRSGNCSRDVALECLRAGRQEERIVLTPYGEEWWFVCAELVLKSRIERDVAFLVAEQI